MIYKGHEISDCDCGGPQYGTDHAPDCRMILDADEIERLISEEKWEQKIARDERAAM